jgi:hypothetical protein
VSSYLLILFFFWVFTEKYTMEGPLIESIADYREKLRELFEDEKEKTSSLDDLIDQAKKLLHRKPKEPGNSFEDLVFFHTKNHKHARDLFVTMMKIRDCVEHPMFSPDAIDSSLSRTFRLDTAESLGELLIKFKEYEVAYSAKEIAATKESSKQIFNALVEDFSEKKLEFVAKESMSSTSLFASVMQKCIDFASSDPSRRQLLELAMDLVEVAKDKALQHKKNRWPKPAYSIPLRTYGFLPVTKSMNLKKLIGIFDKGQRTLPKTNDATKFLREYAAMSGVSFIVGKKILDHPVEYSASVVGRKISDTGITKAIVENFSVIEQLESNKWEFGWGVYLADKSKDEQSSRFCVLETLDGQNFRMMAPWLKGRWDLPFVRVKSLLKGIETGIKPDRATNYHALCEQEAIKHMFLRRKMDEEPHYSIDSQKLQSEVFLRLMNFIQKEANKAKKYNDSLVNHIIHATEIREIFESTLIEFYSEGAKNSDIKKYDAGRARYGELLGTYLAELRQVVRRFMKELHDGYNRNPIDWRKIGEKRGFDIVMKRLEDLLMGVLNILISDKTNLYTTLNHKYFLLNFR